MDLIFIADLLAATLAATVPLALCVTGVVIGERSGVLNLGQEGIMLMGAVCAFMVALNSGSYLLASLAGAAVGAAMGAAFALLTLVFQSNAVATGLALTIFGTGLSAFLGEAYVGESISGLGPLLPEALRTVPLLGPVFFGHDALFYAALVLCLLVHRVLHTQRVGLMVSAVGENPETAHRLGLPVLRTRWLTAIIGCAFTGLGGAYLAIVYTPLWTEGMTAGRGWIALALVVLAGWRVSWGLLAAFGFGFISISNLVLQGLGVTIPVNLLATLPFVMCLLALVIVSSGRRSEREPPRSLGQTYIKEN
ncbi:MAG: ABC transporter permease [Pseudomonadota bacterium]